MMNQVKIDQSNQHMGQKQTMQSQQTIQTHVQNINAQSVTIQSIGVPPQNAQQLGQTQNQIQIQPILQQQQHQPNQIPIDQSGGQIQFVNSAPPGSATNFNNVPQQQQMKIVQQQINIQQQPQPTQQQQQQPQQQMQVS